MRVIKLMRMLLLLIRGVYDMLLIPLLPLQLLVQAFYEELLERFTPSGQQRKRERQEGEQRDERLKMWVAEEYPKFSFEYCPVDPADENAESLSLEWAYQCRDICDDFDDWEQEHGPYQGVSKQRSQKPNRGAKIEIRVWMEAVIGWVIALVYLWLVAAVVLWLLKLAWRGLEVIRGLIF